MSMSYMYVLYKDSANQEPTGRQACRHVGEIINVVEWRAAAKNKVFHHCQIARSKQSRSLGASELRGRRYRLAFSWVDFGQKGPQSQTHCTAAALLLAKKEIPSSSDRATYSWWW